MKATYKYPSKSVSRQKSREVTINKSYFLYLSFVLFEEDFYQIDSKKNRRLLKKNPKTIFVGWSAVAIKHLIASIRHWDFLRKVHPNSLTTDLYLYPLMQLICIILSLFLPFQAVDYDSFIRLETSKSIHSIFFFLEDRFIRSNQLLNISFPYNFHLESIIRLFRVQIQDVSFLHLLRIIFSVENYSYRKIFYLYHGEQKRNLSNLIRNSYILMIDLVLLIPWKEIFKLWIESFLIVDALNIYRKERNLSGCKFKEKPTGMVFPLNNRLSIHYARWTNSLFIAFHATGYFTKKWLSYFCILLRYHFYFRTNPKVENLPLPCAKGVFFLSYVLIVQIRSIPVRINNQVGFCTTALILRKLYPEIPDLRIITLLIKFKFFNVKGYPISKFTWISLTDDDILYRFQKLCQTFLFYYSASMNSRILRKLIYTLQISRDNTLAIKHKSTIRMLLKKPTLLCKSKLKKNSMKIWQSACIRFVFLEFSLLRMNLS